MTQERNVECNHSGLVLPNDRVGQDYCTNCKNWFPARRHAADGANETAAPAKRKVLYSEMVKQPGGKTLADMTPAEIAEGMAQARESMREISDFLAWASSEGISETEAIPPETWERYRREHPRAVEPFRPTRRASLPRLHCVESNKARQLPDFPESADAPPRQLDLPGFQPPVTACPSWLLWLYDQAGGESMAQGRGAPWPLRLFVGALLHLPIADRNFYWHTLRFPADEVIGWLHPDGWLNRRRDWERFPAALDDMRARLGYVPVPGLGSVAMLVPSVIPRRLGDPLVEFTIRIPSEAAKGASIDWPVLCQYGKKSAALYRAYLSAVAFMDRSSHSSHAITAEIGAPVLDAKGNPKRRKGGALVRSRDVQIANPAAQYVKALGDKDLTRMIGFDPENRSQRQDTRKAFDRLHADGIIDLQREGGGYRIFKPARTVS